MLTLAARRLRIPPSNLSDPVRLHSPFGREDCIERLRAGVDSPWAMFGRHAIIGEVGATHANLRRRVRYQGLFRFCLEVSIVPDGNTLLICRPGPHPLAAMLSMGWFGLLFAVTALSALFAVASGMIDHVWILLLVPIGLLALGGFLFLTARGSAAEDHAFLIGQLRRMTEADPVQTAPP